MKVMHTSKCRHFDPTYLKYNIFFTTSRNMFLVKLRLTMNLRRNRNRSRDAEPGGKETEDKAKATVRDAS